MSFFKFMNNIMPPMANDAKDDVDMSPQQQDALLQHQLSLVQPRYLTPEALLLAGIVDHPSVGAKVFKVLVKKGFVLPASTPAAAPHSDSGSVSQLPPSGLTVDTTKIDRRFASRFAAISVHAQRKLVGLLFFWEDECARWRRLDAEEAEAEATLRSTEAEATQGADERRVAAAAALRDVRVRKALLPSQRGSEGPSAE
jgi:hypothetical protein